MQPKRLGKHAQSRQFQAFISEGITLHIFADFNFPSGRRDRLRLIIGSKNNRYLSYFIILLKSNEQGKGW